MLFFEYKIYLLSVDGLCCIVFTVTTGGMFCPTREYRQTGEEMEYAKAILIGLCLCFQLHNMIK